MASIETRGPLIGGVTWFLCLFCGAFLALRVYAKLSRHQRLWWDDWILLFSWTCLFAESVITQMGINIGFGRHFYDIEPSNLMTIAMYTSIGASISCFASTGSKVGFGVTLLRLTSDWYRVFVWFAVVTLSMIMLPSATLTWLKCTPVQKNFNSQMEGTCWDKAITLNYGIFNAAWCAAMDFLLAMIPWKLIWGLRMRRHEKLGICIAMSLGWLSGVCAIIKGVYLVQLEEGDFFFNGKDVTIWTAVETATAIIAGSIPVLRVFAREKASTHGYNSNKHENSHNMELNSYHGTVKSPTVRDTPELQLVTNNSLPGDEEIKGGILQQTNEPKTQQSRTVVTEYVDIEAQNRNVSNGN